LIKNSQKNGQEGDNLKKYVILHHQTLPNMKEDRFITVKIFTFPADATIAQTFMEMRGIEIFMKNLTSNRLAYSFGDIEMQVRSADYEKAKEALIAGGFAKPEDFQ
jgi:hypothetical protein